MKKLQTTKQWGRAIAALTLTATTAQAVNFAVSTQREETIVPLMSQPLPRILESSAQGFVLVTGRVECDAGSVVLRLGAEPGAPGLTLVFHGGEAHIAVDGEAPGDVSGAPGNGVFDFQLSIRHLAQAVRSCRLETRKLSGKFETVAQRAWSAPRLQSQEPVSWLAAGFATAGVAGVCRIEHFSMQYVVPGSLMMVR